MKPTGGAVRSARQGKERATRAGPLAELGKRRLSGERAGWADAASGREETGPGSLGLAEKKGKGARAGLRKGARAGLKEGLG